MNIEDKPIRIAMIIGKWVGGGVESVIMNYYRHIDRNKIQFDFICDEDSTNIPYEEIEKLGGKVIIVPPYQKVFKYIKELKRIFKQNNYKIVHSNINTLSVFPLYAAKKVNVPIRIAHSHSSINKSKKELLRNIIKIILKNFSKTYATHYFACSQQAGISQFGEKTFNDGKIEIIKNAISLDDFSFNKNIRNKIREELGIKNNDLVIGHVGRFVKTKNHDLIVDIFNELYKENKNYKLMLIGQGPLQEIIKQKVKDLGIENQVIFLGQQSNTSKYYQAMDLFLFPSLYEGLGMVFVEAQVSALPSIASTEVPQEAKVSDRAYFIGLDEPIKEWTKKIKEVINQERKVDTKRIKEAGYDIEIETKKLEKIYQNMMK
ncbi:MAG: glycosyltransferase family 1 protein [Bacilli bacterium]|nr:glycosyltransferase family 1 protein [Bacilli bacterium]